METGRDEAGDSGSIETTRAEETRAESKGVKPLKRYAAIGTVAVAWIAVCAIVYTMYFRKAPVIGEDPESNAPEFVPGLELLVRKIDPQTPNQAKITIDSKSGVAGASKYVESDSKGRRIDRGVLHNELFRQALLITLRDRLGYSVRDEMIGEELPRTSENAKSIEFRCLIVGRELARVHLEIATAPEAGGRSRAVWSKSFGLKSPSQTDPAVLTAAAERLSREDFAEALSLAGVQSLKPIEWKTSGAAPETVEERLGRASFASQFSAIRDLRRSIQADGESPERLGALVRAYANLGVLCERHWNPAHKAYKARALLLAERLVGRDAKSAHSYWIRGYARSLIGVHKHAIEDLDLAEKTVPAGDRAARPPWADVARAFSERNHEKLDELARDPKRARFVTLLAMIAVENGNNNLLTLRYANAALAVDPGSRRVLDTMNHVYEVGNLHKSTIQSLVNHWQILPGELREISDLPESATAALKRNAPETGVVRELAAAEAGASEPSWGALASLIREARFANIADRAYFVAFILSAPDPVFVSQSIPLIESHPFRSVVELFAQGPQERDAALRKLRDGTLRGKLPLDYESSLVLRIFQKLEGEYNPSMIERMVDRGDHVARDLDRGLDWGGGGGEMLPAAVAYLESDPYAPAPAAMLLTSRWDRMASQADDLEKMHSRQPDVLLAIGRQHMNTRHWEEAERCFLKSIAASPSSEAYRALANVRDAQKGFDAWRATLEEFLEKTEETGLKHANVRVEIARRYMKLGEFAKAEPFADAAAESWAEWAMRCAAENAQQLGNLDKAETYYRRISERYANRAHEWWIWRLSVGRSDDPEARDLAAPFALARGENPRNAAEAVFSADFFELSDRPEHAWEILRNAATTQDEASALLKRSILAEAIKNPRDRDESLAKARDQLKAQGVPSEKILSALIDWIAAGKGEPDFAVIDETLKSLTPAGRANLSHAVGRFLQLRGLGSRAIPYLEHCANGTDAHFLVKASASKHLAEIRKRSE